VRNERKSVPFRQALPSVKKRESNGFLIEVSDQKWIIRLGEEVALVSPSGAAILGLPYKASGLVALVAAMFPEPVSRTSAGNILWPRASAKARQASLRQAIRALRQSTAGAPFLDAGRTTLALNPDWVRVEQAASRMLLRRFSEPWFVLFRASPAAARRSASEAQFDVEEASAVQRLEEFLDWMIGHQPEQAYGIIYHAVDLATSLPPHRALALSQRLLRPETIQHPLRGWANLLHAFALFFNLQMEAAAREFRNLRAAALSRGDHELMVMSAFFEAGCLLPMGGLDHADAVMAQSRKVNPRRLSARAAARLAHGSGLVACCRGDYARGLADLERAIDHAKLTSQTYELAYASANTAWIAASVGHAAEAARALTIFEEADTGAHWRFRLTTELARLHLLCAEGDPESAWILGENALQTALSLQALGFEIYLRESLARCHCLLGRVDRATEEIQMAHHVRERIHWKVIPWDTDRLALAMGAHSLP